jgi:phosphoglycolate phosphatase
MGKYDLVIFDVDGTLLDTTEGLLEAVKYTVNRCGFIVPEDDVIKTFIGPPIKESFLRTYDIDDRIADELTKVFRTRYKDVDLLKAKPYPEILGIFDSIEMAGIKSAIATYKRQDYAERIVRHFGFSKYTDIIFGSDNDNKMRKKDIIEKCIAVSEINDWRRVLMVGDSDNDAVAARQLGIDFLGVTYGFGFSTKEEVYSFSAVYAADNACEILNFFIEKGKD